MKAFTKGDRIIAAIVVFVSFFSYLVFAFFTINTRPIGVEVFVDGKLYSSYDLSDFKKEEKVEVISKYGESTLEISADGARITNSSCPDKKCIKEGKITKVGQALICIPNKVLIKLTGKNNSEVDRVTY